MHTIRLTTRRACGECTCVCESTLTELNNLWKPFDEACAGCIRFSVHFRCDVYCAGDYCSSWHGVPRGDLHGWGNVCNLSLLVDCLGHTHRTHLGALLAPTHQRALARAARRAFSQLGLLVPEPAVQPEGLPQSCATELSIPGPFPCGCHSHNRKLGLFGSVSAYSVARLTQRESGSE